MAAAAARTSAARPALLRLFNDLMGGQASWLLPAALLALGRRAVGHPPARRAPIARARHCCCGAAGCVVSGLVFSSAGRHPHLLHGRPRPGDRRAGRDRRPGAVGRRDASARGKIVAAGAVLVTAAWAWELLDRTPDWAAVAARDRRRRAARRRRPARGARRRTARAAAPGRGRRPVRSSPGWPGRSPTRHRRSPPPTPARFRPPARRSAGLGGGRAGWVRVGSGGTAGGRGGPPGGRARAQGPAVAPGGTGAARPRAAVGLLVLRGAGRLVFSNRGSASSSPSSSHSSFAGAAFGGRSFGGGAGGGAGGITVSCALKTALEADAGRYRWVAAASGSQSAASLELATGGEPVMAIGGFDNQGGNCRSPVPALRRPRRDPLLHRLRQRWRWAGPGGGPGRWRCGRCRPRRWGAGASSSSAISSWVKANFKAVKIGNETVYDLTQASS